LYHAQSKASAAERRYVLSFLGDAASGAETAARWQFVDPERREIETDGAAVLLKESIYPKWSARFVGLDGAQRPLRIAYAGPDLHLTDGNTEGVRAEAERATEPLEEGEGRGCVVAQAVEAVGEREIRRRAVPACPPQAGPLERRAQCVGGEVEEVLPRLEVVPE